VENQGSDRINQRLQPFLYKPVGYNKTIPVWRDIMEPSFTLKYTPTQQDYARTIRLFMMSRTSNRISLGFLVVAFAIVVFSISTKATPITLFEIIWLLFPPLFIIYIIVIQPTRMAKQAMQNEHLSAETTWEVNEAGVQISTSLDTSLYEWDKLARLMTRIDYYLLLFKTNKNTFRFLPRRSFTSTEDEDNFLQLMTSHLAK
jgi:hypothetical protein